jgi:xylan 1,4-beta-xylosidase
MGQPHKIRDVKVFVDAGKRLGDLRRIWRYIGYDEINYTTTLNGEATLKKFMRLADAPYYVRAHHLLCTGNCRGIPKWGSTNAYIEDEKGNPVYNWKFIDEIFDTYLRCNCKPFVELGFMPLDLADNRGQLSHYWWYSGWAHPPKDYQKWYDLIRNLVKHCTDRYGADEAEKWYWELWNEPDIQYWQGSLEEYCKLYDYTVAAIEKTLPKAKIGGPATTGPGRHEKEKSNEWLDKFLDHCINGENFFNGQKGTRLDFVSFHAKGANYRPLWGRYGDQIKKQLPSIKSLISQVKLGLEIIEKYPSLKHIKCILSECDTDGMAAYGAWDNPNLAFRNTEYYPSYVVTAFKKLMDLAEHHSRELDALTWAFMFEGERCFEGTRTFTTNGVDKPILNLFRMYSLLGNTRLYFASTAAKDPLGYKDDNGIGEDPDMDGIAAISKDNNIQVLLFCHHDDWSVKGTYDVEIEIANIPFNCSKCRLTHYRIDQECSNAHTEWVRQGRPNYPTLAQTRAIKSKMELELYEPKTEVTLQRDKFQKTVTLPVHGISLLILAPK